MQRHIAQLLPRYSRLRALPVQLRGFAAEPAQSSEPESGQQEITVTVNAFKGHRLDELPSTEVKTSKAELMGFFKQMCEFYDCAGSHLTASWKARY